MGLHNKGIVDAPKGHEIAHDLDVRIRVLRDGISGPTTGECTLLFVVGCWTLLTVSK